MIVVIEGIDRVGKTTLANMLKEAGFVYLKDEFIINKTFLNNFSDYSVGKCDSFIALAKAYFAGGGQPFFTLGQGGNSAVGRTKRRGDSFGGFVGKQLHLQLLHGVQLRVPFQVQLHRFVASFI